MSMFEKATRQSLRFDTAKGQLSVEDIWQLPLTSKSGVSLDAIAVDLYKKLQNENVSFVGATTSNNASLQLKFDIVKHIIDVRKAENEAAATAAATAARRQQILALIEQKKNEQLSGLSVDELEKLL